jgi:flagellar protein FliO/FliZ
MTQVLLLILAVAFLATAVVAAAFLVRRYGHGSSLSTLFAPKSQRRLDIVEQATVDGKRKLLLVRRDDVEHLVMTGGPADIVIESGISAPSRTGEARQPSSLLTRTPRPLAAGDR